MKEFFLGNELIALGAISAGARAVYSYPGTPASEILASFMKYAPDRYAQWSVNEKVALEIAAGEAICGNFVLCAMKQVGLNVAADPLFSTAYTGVEGALVIVSADDPGPHSSQTEQDSRMYAMAAQIPVFDPCNPVDAYRLVRKAFSVSHEFEIPVLFRPVMRVCHSRQNFDAEDMETADPTIMFNRDPGRWAATPHYRAVLHDELLKKLDAIALAEYAGRDVPGANRLAVVTSGYPDSIVRDVQREIRLPVDIIPIDMPYPIAADYIRRIEDAYERVLVLEETFPVIENQFTDRRRVSGKSDGTVQSLGEITADDVERSLSAFVKTGAPSRAHVALDAPPPAKPRLCAGCGHRPAFYAIRKAAPGGIYPGDIGCYTLGVNLNAVDSCLCMGASITLAEGIRRANPAKTVIATIGDSTFFHSGLPALVNMRMNNSDIVVCILDNATTAMTGFQPVPHEVSDISIEGLVKGIGIQFIRSCDPYRLGASIELVKEAMQFSKANSTPSVIIFRHPCITHGENMVKKRVAVLDSCRNCAICYRQFECPAIYEDRAANVARIDAAACCECGVCIDVCPFGSIVEAGDND